MVAPLRWMYVAPTSTTESLNRGSTRNISMKKGSAVAAAREVVTASRYSCSKASTEPSSSVTSFVIVRRYVMRAEVEPDVARRRRSVALA